MNEATKPINPEKEKIHLEAESRVHTFRYAAPSEVDRVKQMVNMVRTPNVRVQVQVVHEGGENNLHYHTNSDGVWMVLKGAAKFYGPGGARYWFETTGDVPLEILHITAVENAKTKDQRINVDRHKDWMTESNLQVYDDK
jgi:mannose-6-phosphate isomerase-like protein (cupin superfamily)